MPVLCRAITAAVLCAALVMTGGPVRAQPPSLVRVGLLLAQEAVTIGADGPFDVIDGGSGRRETLEGGQVVFRAGTRGIESNAAAYVGPLRLQPQSGLLQVNGRPYRGFIELRRTAGRLTAINELDI